MLVKCPHCGNQLKLGDSIQHNIHKLDTGRKIKIKCMRCLTPFDIDSKDIEIPPISPHNPKEPKPAVKTVKNKVKPPVPPSIDWLEMGIYDDKGVVDDIPRALVLMPDTSMETVVEAATGFGYRVTQAATPEEAIKMMRFVNYAAVFLHVSYETNGIQSGEFYRFMQKLDMVRRRHIFYVLIDEQLKTLYGLQALTYSANLVVDDVEISHIGTIFKKAIPEYEVLFGPLIKDLRIVSS